MTGWLISFTADYVMVYCYTLRRHLVITYDGLVFWMACSLLAYWIDVVIVAGWVVVCCDSLIIYVVLVIYKI